MFIKLVIFPGLGEGQQHFEVAFRLEGQHVAERVFGRVPVTAFLEEHVGEKWAISLLKSSPLGS